MTVQGFKDIVGEKLFEIVIKKFNEEHIRRGKLYQSEKKKEEMDFGEEGVIYYFDEQLGDSSFHIDDLIEVKVVYENLSETLPDSEISRGYKRRQFYQYPVEKSYVVGANTKLFGGIFYEWDDIRSYPILDVDDKKIHRYLLYPQTDIQKKLENEGIVISLKDTETVNCYLLFKRNYPKINLKKLLFGHIFFDQSFQHLEEKDLLLKLLEQEEGDTDFSFDDGDLSEFEPDWLPLLSIINFNYPLQKEEYLTIMKLIFRVYSDEFYDYINPFFNFCFIDQYDLEHYLKRQIKENNYRFINQMAGKSFGNQDMYRQPIEEIKRRFSDYSDFRLYLEEKGDEEAVVE